MPQTPWALTFIDYGQVVNECNRNLDRTSHSEECDGNCPAVELFASEVDLHNEIVHWNKHEWTIQGVPDSFLGLGPPGIGINLLRLDWVQQALIEFLIDMDIINEDELDERLRKVKVKTLQKIRREQEEIMAREAGPQILTPDKRILGPNGEIIH